MKFYNKIDYVRKFGDMLAIFIFLGLAYYVDKQNIPYKDLIFILLIIFAICDTIFTYDAIRVHGFAHFFNPKFI